MSRSKQIMRWEKLGMMLFLTLATCSTVRAAEPAKKPQPMPEGLVGYWKLNEGKNTIAFDSSGNGAHAEIVGDAKWESGESGPVLSFDGETSMVKIPDGGWNNGDPMTLMCWWNSENKQGMVFQHCMTGVVAGCYSLSASGKFGGYGTPKPDESDEQASKGEISLAMPSIESGDWHFAVIVFDTKEIRGYLDGELAASTPIDGWPRVGGALTLGARELTEKNDNFFKGQIREMAVFNRALTKEEIAAIHAAYLKGHPLYSPPAGQKIP